MRRLSHIGERVSLVCVLEMASDYPSQIDMCGVCRGPGGTHSVCSRCTTVGLVHLECIVATILPGRRPKCPGCQSQLPQHLVNAWKAQAIAKGYTLGSKSSSDAKPELEDVKPKVQRRQKGSNKKKAQGKDLTRPSQIKKKTKKKAQTGSGAKQLSPRKLQCPGGKGSRCGTFHNKSNWNRHMRSYHPDHPDAPSPVKKKYTVDPEDAKGCPTCLGGFKTKQDRDRHRASSACGPPIDLTGDLTTPPKVVLLLYPDSRWTPGDAAEGDYI